MFRHIAPPDAKKAGKCHTAIGVTVFSGTEVLENKEEMDISAVDITAIFQNFLGLYPLNVQGHLLVSSQGLWL